MVLAYPTQTTIQASQVLFAQIQHFSRWAGMPPLTCKVCLYTWQTLLAILTCSVLLIMLVVFKAKLVLRG
jgi:hypothetical protein